MTIPEVLVTCIVTIILFGMIFQVLVPAFHLANEGATKTELQQLAMLSVNQMVTELGQVPPTGVSLAIPSTTGVPMIMATNPIFDTDSSTGTPIYQARLRIFWNEPGNGNLYRKDGDVPPPFNPTPPVQMLRAQLDPIITSKNGTERRLAHHVESFRVEKETTTGGEVYAIRLHLVQELSGTPRKADVDVLRKVFLRNH